MSSIIWNGGTYHGISVDGRGVFKDKNCYWSYAGQHRDGYACGLAVLTQYDGYMAYAELGPDGEFDGRNLDRWADGDTYYTLYERGNQKDWATRRPDGRQCYYNGVVCAPDDPRFLALIAQVAPVEVRPAARAPTRYSPATRPQAIVRWISRLVLPFAGARHRRGRRGPPPLRTPSLVAARNNPTAAALQSATTQ